MGQCSDRLMMTKTKLVCYDSFDYSGESVMFKVVWCLLRNKIFACKREHLVVPDKEIHQIFLCGFGVYFHIHLTTIAAMRRYDAFGVWKIGTAWKHVCQYIGPGCDGNVLETKLISLKENFDGEMVPYIDRWCVVWVRISVHRWLIKWKQGKFPLKILRLWLWVTIH